MKFYILYILLFLNCSILFCQPDTLKFTENQHKKFQSILDELDSMISRTEELNLNNVSFDSLIVRITHYENDNQFYKSKETYLFAKEVYPNNCKFHYDKNPNSCGCIFNEDAFTRFKEMIDSSYETLLLLENDDMLDLTKGQKRQVYLQEVEALLIYLELLPEFYDTDLEARSWVTEYFNKLQEIQLLII